MCCVTKTALCRWESVPPCNADLVLKREQGQSSRAVQELLQSAAYVASGPHRGEKAKKARLSVPFQVGAGLYEKPLGARD